MEVLFLYMKFWTNHYNNKMCPKFMYKNRTFYSPLVFFFFLKVLPAILLSRQTVQTGVQTTAENHVCNWDGRYSQWLFLDNFLPYLQLPPTIYTITLYTPGHLEISWEVFAKKSADVLSFRNFFITISNSYHRNGNGL